MKTRVIATIAIVAFSVTSSFASPASTLSKWAFGGLLVWAGWTAFKPVDVEAKLAAKIQADLDTNKNAFFHKIHPVGTATSVKVHNVKSFWRVDNPKNLNDLQGFVVSYTIYWRGPIITDGYTKLASMYDGDIGRYTKSKVIETNGITNDDAMQGALAFLDGCLSN